MCNFECISLAIDFTFNQLLRYLSLLAGLRESQENVRNVPSRTADCKFFNYIYKVDFDGHSLVLFQPCINYEIETPKKPDETESINRSKFSYIKIYFESIPADLKHKKK